MSVHTWLFSRFSLRSRFSALIATLVFATTLLLGWVASRESAQQVEASIGTATAEAAYQMVDKLERNMDARIKEVKLLLGMQALTNAPWRATGAARTIARQS